jgi:hypothetical protein
MLIKSADDKSQRIDLLESLLQTPRLGTEQRRWLQDQLKAQRYGAQGERDAAHYIDNHFSASGNHAVIHDLRVEVDGEVAQIDHLVIARGFTFYLLETKNFSGNLEINEFGEFSVRYGAARSFGIPSPLEQSKRHENVLVKLLDKLEISGRVSRRPEFKHVVLIHPKGVIRRPDPVKFNTSNVIKADQFASWRERHIDKEMSVGQVFGSLLNMRSTDTLREWAEKICRQHRPANLLDLPDFLRSQCNEPLTDQVAVPRLSTEPTQVDATVSSPKRLVCATCGSKISYPEGKFCWNNAKRFNGLQYCREHQAAF